MQFTVVQSQTNTTALLTSDLVFTKWYPTNATIKGQFMFCFLSILQLYFYLLVQSREVKQGQTWMSYSSYFQCQGRAFSRTRIFSLAASTTEVIIESHDKSSCECWIMKPFPLKCINTVYILWKKTKQQNNNFVQVHESL